MGIRGWITLALLLAFGQAPAQSEDRGSREMPEGVGPWVVQAWFDNDRPLNLLLQHAAPWKADRKAGVLTIDVANRFEYQRMLNEGFSIRVDEYLTQRYLTPPQRLAGQVNAIPGFLCYRTVAETFASADALVATYPQIVEIIDIGDSWAKTQNVNNGSDLKVLRLTNRSITGTKPVHYLQGGLHAREYVTAETVTRYGEWLASRYGIDPDVTWVLDHHEVHILMQANPDGRKVAELSTTGQNRQQRKNFNTTWCPGTVSGASQPGTDLNRNFPFDWAGPGSSPTQCNLSFRGPSASSEPESAAIIAYLRTIFPDQRNENPNTPGGDVTTPVPLDATGIYMDVHANAARTWYSWGNNSTPAPNATQLASLGRKISYYNGYVPEPGEFGGAIGGATDDFVYGTLGVPSFTVEMDGIDFFPSCSTYENSMVQKNLNAFWMASKLVRAPLRLAAGPELTNLIINPATVAVDGQAAVSLQASDNRFNNSGGTEPTQAVAGVAVYLTPPWMAGATPIAAMSASDGSFNTSVEAAGWTLTGNLLAQGRQLVYFQATDSAGNKGPVASLWVTRDDVRVFADGFE